MLAGIFARWALFCRIQAAVAASRAGYGRPSPPPPPEHTARDDRPPARAARPRPGGDGVLGAPRRRRLVARPRPRAVRGAGPPRQLVPRRAAGGGAVPRLPDADGAGG